jgi:hypothetical protein
MIVKGSTMYGFTGNQIVTYDLTNPDTPVEHGTYGPISGTFTDRLILGNWMFTLTADSVMVFDISDPFNPDFVTALGMPYADMSALTIMGQYLIASSPNHHPVFIDVSDPASPSIYGEPITTDKFFTIEGVIANDGYLYELADSIGVRIFKFF